MAKASKENKRIIILILGSLCTLSPLSIDMYLPAFNQMAQSLNTTAAKISLSLSSYFIGLALGQLFYGPLLDRYGRKRPLYFGLLLYTLASVACLYSRSATDLIVYRIFQALGGCAASVASMAMVRDFFPVKEASKIFSLLMLILGVSPLLAPTFGSFLTQSFGWQSIFVVFVLVALSLIVLCFEVLPEGHKADTTISLKPKRIAREYFSILKNSQFTTYTFAGSFSFSGLFVYVAGSPILFLDVFKVSIQTYGIIFAFLAAGFIGGSQINVFLNRHHSSQNIFKHALSGQVFFGILFLALTLLGFLTLPIMICILMLFLLCAGISSPNSSAVSLAPFTKNAGSAAALLGFIQMGIGAGASSGVGLLESKSILPIACVLCGSSLIAKVILISGKRKIKTHINAEEVSHSIH